MTATADELLEHCLRDQAEHWQRGEQIHVEAYLARHVELTTDDLRMDLIYAEILLREGGGEVVSFGEYTERFPDLQERIESLARLHAAFATSPTPAAPLPRVREPKAPLSLTRYAHYALIGRGGMGTVYHARDLDLDRDVAIKILNPSGEDLGWDVRLRKEAGTVARLQHPNIVQIYDVGEDEGRPYLVLEYINGGTLAERILKEPLNARHAATLIRTIAIALQAAHERQIIHRDLKPANILLQTTDGEPIPKLTDFGLAKLLDSRSESRSGEFVGSVHYMAPEQATGQEIGPASDIYSLGVIFYECVTGRPPFLGANPLTVLSRAANADPVPPSRLLPEFPRDLEAVILKCLAAETARRYASASSLVEDIDCFLEGRPTLARPTTHRDRALKWMRRNPLAASLAALAMVLLLAGIAGVVWQWRNAVASQFATEQALLSEAEQRRKTDLNLYSATISQAMLFSESGDVERARRLLKDVVPAVGQTDHRGWEWHYLDQLTHSELQVIPCDQWCNQILPIPGTEDYAVALGLPRMNAAHTPSPIDGRAAILKFAPTAGLLSGPPLPSGATVAAIDPHHSRIAWGTPSGMAVIATISDSKIVQTLSVGFDISGLGFCEQGNVLLIGDTSGVVTAYEVDTGRKIRSQQMWKNARCLIAVSPDERHVLVSGGRKLAPLMTAATWQKEFNLAEEDDIVTTASFDLANTVAFTGNSLGTIAIWSLTDGKEIRRSKLHTGPIYAIAVTPDGQHVASAGSDRVIRLWDRRNGELVASFRGHTGTVRCLAFSVDGTQLISGSQDGSIRVWNARQNPRGVHLPFHSRLNAAWAERHGQDLQVRAAQTAGVVTTWAGNATGAFRSESSMIPLSRNTGYPVSYAAFVNDGRWVAGIPRDNPKCLAIWDVASGKEIRRSPIAAGKVVCVDTNLSGTAVVWATERDRERCELHVWLNTASTPDKPRIIDNPAVRALAIDNDAKNLVSLGRASNSQRTLTLWHCVRTEPTALSRIGTFDSSYGALEFSPDGLQLALGADDQIHLFSMPDAAWQSALPNAGRPTAVAFTPDQKRLAIVGYDGLVSILHVETGQVLIQLPGLIASRPDDLACDARVRFTSDGKTLISTNWDGSLNIWNAP